jgi:hypothetical protein
MSYFPHDDFYQMPFGKRVLILLLLPQALP